jgi:hypothetical protein
MEKTVVPETGRGKYPPPANPERVTLEALSEGTRVFFEGEYFSAARSDFSGDLESIRECRSEETRQQND